MMLADAQQRQQALDVSSSFIVQAPAGSGKTGVLTQRILKLLAIVERPEQILAITFTKKAAAEMRNRVAEALHNAAHSAEPEQEYERAFYQLARAALERDSAKKWGLTENLGRLRLQTIDSLCSSIVRENPLVSGLGVQFNVTDDATDLYVEASRSLLAMLDESGEAGQALHRILQSLDNRYDRLSSLIVQMLMQRDHWLRDVINIQNNWDGFRTLLESSLRKINTEAEQRISALMSTHQQTEFQQLTQYAVNQLILAKSEHSILALEPGSLAYRKLLYAMLLTSEGNFRVKIDKRCGFPPAKDFSSKDEKRQADDCKQRMLELIQSLADVQTITLPAISEFISAPPVELSEEQWRMLNDLVLVVRYAAAHLKLVFQQRKSVDFSEVALAALLAMGHAENPGDAALAMDERIQHILVDEFQDTSFMQVDLLEKLTEGWSPGDGRTLFLVGDPMQSIYAFRKADVGLFLRLWHRKQLGHIPLQALKLSMNFRSSPAVLDWVNGQFDKAFPPLDDIRAGAVCYSFSHAGKALKENDTTAVTLFAGPDIQACAMAEGRWIAEHIHTLQNTESVAILVKGKAHILHIASALREHGIPFQAVEIEKLAESQIIADLLTLVRVYTSPMDKVAWFALLRGPWCGFTLQELQYVADADPSPWLAINKLCALPSPLQSSIQTRLQQLQEIMTYTFEKRFQLPLVEVIRDLALQLGIAATARSESDIDAMELFFAMLGKVDSVGGIPDPDNINKQLQKLFVPPDPIVADFPLVQIMTMHKSKGLEFDVVFLPQLQRSNASDDKPLILIDKQTLIEDNDQELFVAPRGEPTVKNSTSVYDYLWRLKQQRNRHEAVRLLYVACTRARRKLYLTACLKEDEKISAPVGGSLLAVIWPHVSMTAEKIEVPTREYLRIPPDFRRMIHKEPAQVRHPLANTHASEFKAIQNSSDSNHEIPEDYRRHAGILLHKLFELWASAPDLVPVAILDGQLTQWRQYFSSAGVATADQDNAVELVAQAIRTVLSNTKRVEWLFRTRHADDHTEFPITILNLDTIENLIIDRTFVQDGTRYIIDYKLAAPDSDLDSFLQHSRELYSAQLRSYRKALQARDGLPCRTFLYFPMIDHLLETED